MQAETFSIHRPRPDRTLPLIVHIPHVGRVIPLDLNDGFQHVYPTEIGAMLGAMFDEGADVLFDPAVHYGATVFRNDVCRVAYDPERFENDEDEPMSRHGLGMVYTHTLDGEPLRPTHLVDDHRRLVIERYHRPYVAAFEALVDEYLVRFGEVWILDVHTFPDKPLPYEDPDGPRPVVCLGYESRERAQPEALDWFDSQEHLLHDLVQGVGAPALLHNAPFAGSYVPPKHLNDPRVKSIMVEVNRACFREFGAIADAFGRWLASFIDERLEVGRQAWPKPLAYGVATGEMVRGGAPARAVIGDVVDGDKCSIVFDSDGDTAPVDSRIRECWVCFIEGLGPTALDNGFVGVVLVDKWTSALVWSGAAEVSIIQGEVVG